MRAALLVLALVASQAYAQTCGNGIVEDGEQCDDGNTFSYDGCTSDCKKELGLCTFNCFYANGTIAPGSTIVPSTLDNCYIDPQLTYCQPGQTPAASFSWNYDAAASYYYLGGDCDTAEFDLTSGCALTQGYWGTHYDGATPVVKDIPWPGADQCETCGPYDITCALACGPTGCIRPQVCYDSFRTQTENSNSLYYLNENYYAATFPGCPPPPLACQGPFGCTQKGFFACSSGSVACTANGGPVSPLQVIEKGGAQNDQNTWCWKVGRQYIASLANLCNGACYGYGGTSSEFYAAMQIAADFLFSEGCQSDPYNYNNASQAVQDAKDVLDGYNNGEQKVVDGECVLKYGPYHCESSDDPTNTTCRPEPEDCPLDLCEGGCTHTQGYWKNHRLSTKSRGSSGKRGSVTPSWSAVCDTAWLESHVGVDCVDGVCTPLEQAPYGLFASAGLTWAGVQDLPPKGGQACLIAAHQLIAAELNHNCDQHACLTDSVQNAIDQATGIMIEYCADMVVARDGVTTTGGLLSSVNHPNSSATVARRRLLEFAEYLDLYNNGINVGPGHCEDVSDIVIESPVTASNCSSPSSSGNDLVLNKSDQQALLGITIAILCVVGILLLWKCAAAILFCIRGGKDLEKEKGFMTNAAYAFDKYAASAKLNTNPNLRQRYGY